jgi:tetratricopeptide (TPR) repeat protein
VEGEVATMIAQALKAKLSPAEAAAVAQVPTHDKAAYDAYQKARYYLNNSNRSGDREDLVRTVSLLQAATQLDPNFGKAWSLLALAYVKLGGHAKQQAEAARRALEIDPDDANAQIQAAFVHSAEGEHDLAVGLGERAARSQPGAGSVQAGLGWIYLFAGRFDEGAAAFGRAIEVEPNAVSIRLFQSTALSGMRRYAQSRETLQAGQARDPGDMSIVLDLAKLQILERGDLEAARKVLQSASATPAQSVPLAEGWFDVHRLARDYPAALALLAQAPEGMFAQGALTRPHFQARVFQAQGDVARARKASLEARDAMQAHVEAAPAHPAGHAGLALALAGAGDCDAALASAARALELQPVARNAVWGMMWSYAQAQVMARCGHADDAVAQLRQLLREPAGNLVSVPWLRLDPDWDPIRGDAGFQALTGGKD